MIDNGSVVKVLRLSWLLTNQSDENCDTIAFGSLFKLLQFGNIKEGYFYRKATIAQIK